MPGRFFSKRTRRCLILAQLFLWPAVIISLAGVAGVRFNATPSLPAGLYRITSDSKAPFAELCPPGPLGPISVQRGYRRFSYGENCPDGGEPLLKVIIARGGDLVQTSPNGISVNGAWVPNTAPAIRDSEGRPIGAWPFGRYRVVTGTVWVASSYNAKSFDSRYFGPVRVTQIKHYLLPLWTEQ